MNIQSSNPQQQENLIDSLEDIFSRHGLPLTIGSDCGPQFKCSQIQTCCQENGIHHIKTTPKWVQANGEVERQNASLMKQVQIAQAEGQDWRRELRKYVTVYRSIQHSTTGKTSLSEEHKRNVTRHCNTHGNSGKGRGAKKKKPKIYTDNRRSAKTSDIEVRDQVLVRQDKTDKFITTFHSTPHKVMHREGNSVIVQSPTGAK